MLFLVALGLVVVGALSLVIGFLTEATALIYLSITCSVVAFLALVVLARMTKRSDAMVAEGAGAGWPPPGAAPAPAPASAPAVADDAATPEPTPEAEPTTTMAAVASSPVEADDTTTVDDDFPIPGYDRMGVTQILPRLDDLDIEELELVRDHEEEGRNRTSILRRVDRLIDDLEAELAEAEDEIPEEDIEDYDALRVSEILPLLATLDRDQLAQVRQREEQGRNRSTILRRLDLLEAQLEEAEAEPEPLALTPGEEEFPIEDYDRRSVREILARLDDLSDEELDLVAEREEAGRNRAVILNAIDAQFEELDEEPPLEEPPAPPPRAADDVPIEGYDDLRVNEILPFLPTLDLDEVQALRQREEQGKNRPTLIRRLDDRIAELAAEEDATPVAAQPSRAKADGTGDDTFPIPDYDRRTVSEILPLLDDLDNDQLDMVVERERRGKNRRAVLRAVDAMFEQEEPAAEPVTDVAFDPNKTARIPVAKKR